MPVGSVASVAAEASAIAFITIFALACLSKFDSWGTWREAVADFAPTFAVPFAVLAVPLLEGATAVVIATRPSLGLALAAAVLAILAAVVAALNHRHQGHECNCFGAALPARIGWSLVMRNLALAALAAIASAASPSPSLGAVTLVQSLVLMLLVVLVGESLRFFRLPRLSAPGGAR